MSEGGGKLHKKGNGVDQKQNPPFLVCRSIVNDNRTTGRRWGVGQPKKGLPGGKTSFNEKSRKMDEYNIAENS